MTEKAMVVVRSGCDVTGPFRDANEAFAWVSKWGGTYAVRFLPLVIEEVKSPKRFDPGGEK